MLSLSKPIAQAYHLKNLILEFMEAKDLAQAKTLLSQWHMHVQVVNSEPFNKCVNTYVNWETEILNMFIVPYSNGYTEGCNNKIKVIK